MTEARFRKALYYAVRESFNNQSPRVAGIDKRFDSLICEAIEFVESVDELPYEWSVVEAECLGECTRRRLQPALF